MKKTRQFSLIFLLFAYNLSIVQAQYIEEPDCSGFAIYETNGRIHLKRTSPTYFWEANFQRYMNQDWSNTDKKWLTHVNYVTEMNADCSAPLTHKAVHADNTGANFITVTLDTFLYDNNKRLTNRKRYSYYDYSTTKHQYFYKNARTVPDSCYFHHSRLNSGVVDSFSYYSNYEYNRNNQLITASLRNSKNRNNYYYALNYDAQGRLISYRVERQDSMNSRWFVNAQCTYMYNSRSQLEKVTFERSWSVTNPLDTTYLVFTYDALNRLAIIDFSRFKNGVSSFIAKDSASDYNVRGLARQIDSRQVFTTSPLTYYNKYQLTYHSNDSLISLAQRLSKNQALDTFVNSARYFYWYCGDAVATSEAPKQALDFTVFPNPASDNLTIQLADNQQDNANIDITNIAGQVVATQKNYTTNTPLSISDLPSGLYVVKIKFKEKVGTKLVSIMR